MPWIPKDSITSTGDCNRIAIIGPPGSGKTTSLLTFPELIILDRDKNAPPGVTVIPAWNPDWADSYAKRTVKDVPNFRDAIIKFLKENHDKFEPGQTFALDSWTFIQDACDLQTRVEDDLAGNKNNYFFWGQKLKFSKDIAEFIKSMKCNVVVTMHETMERNEAGQLTGKIRPIQDGSYKDCVLGVFNNVWRMRGSMAKGEQKSIAPRNPDGSKKEVERWFYWQLFGDSVVDLKLDATLGRYCRRNGVDKVEIKFDGDKVVGGYQVIQEIYRNATASPVK